VPGNAGLGGSSNQPNQGPNGGTAAAKSGTNPEMELYRRRMDIYRGWHKPPTHMTGRPDYYAPGLGRPLNSWDDRDWTAIQQWLADKGNRTTTEWLSVGASEYSIAQMGTTYEVWKMRPEFVWKPPAEPQSRE